MSLQRFRLWNDWSSEGADNASIFQSFLTCTIEFNRNEVASTSTTISSLSKWELTWDVFANLSSTHWASLSILISLFNFPVPIACMITSLFGEENRLKTHENVFQWCNSFERCFWAKHMVDIQNALFRDSILKFRFEIISNLWSLKFNLLKTDKTSIKIFFFNSKWC